MRMRSKKLAVVAGLIAASLLAACSNSGKADRTGEGNGAKTLRFMVTSENYSGRLKDFIANYETRSGNRVDVQMLPATEFENMLKIKMMSGEGPDLFVTDDIAMSQFQLPKDWFEDLSGEPWANRLSESGKAIIRWNDGRITGLPVTNPGGMGMVYNKAIFQKLGLDIPKTWDEFLKVCERIKQAGIVPVNIQLANGSEFGTTHMMHQLFANAEINRGNDADRFWQDMNAHKIKITEVEEYERALNQMVELKEKGYINDDFISTTFEMSQENLGSGKVAMHPAGDFILEPLLAKYPNVELGFFSMPFGDTPGAIALYAGVGISVNSKAANKAEALELMRLFASKEQQELYLQKSPGISVFADVEAKRNMISGDLQRYMDGGKARMGMFGRYEAWNDMDARKMMQEMMLGKPPKQVLKELNAKMEIVAKGKKLPGWNP
ncbi:ABC transporter substrate-binding protein [Paenibacillus flagellatus]|uniref:Carbohydrate ABC transporter substrate-binding protein n=1 Tax=Paenibacillus flagellatus TaxID=2211139 RepID=A0A2V5JWU5_9BACL|nr:ABC transporter substrate-binding protein [Paenibacillus flagellatus]PYI51285.1 carbohydrate ABC transporter substrate-binding protein [Paenibacillus flagellatus]